MIPYTPIDSLNRRAAATGSPRYGMATAHADYNGHHITVWWNDYRQYYITEYFWAGRMVLARGSFKDCLNAAIAEHKRGALGTSISITTKDGDTEADDMCKLSELVKEGPEGKQEWYTWQHDCAAQSVKDYCFPNSLAMIFDWEIMQKCNSEKEYTEAIREKYGRVYR